MKHTHTHRLAYVGLFILLCIPEAGLAAVDSFVVSEIAAFESNNSERSEWIEIYNRSNEAVDITGWKFVDSVGEKQTTHAIKVPDGVSSVVAAGSYAIIAQNNERFALTYPNVGVQIFDSSWGSLNESGEYISLLDADGVVAEAFTYGVARSHALERVDVLSDDYSDANWLEHASGHSAGLAYVTSTPVVEPDTTEAPLSDELIVEEPLVEEPLESTADVENESAGTQYHISWGSVRINEFVSDPTEYDTEWIELVNLTNEIIDLHGWNLMDGSERRSPLTGELQPESFMVFDQLAFKLNNAGDEIVLLDRFGFVIDRLSYGSWADDDPLDNATRTKKPASSARRFDGVSSGSDVADFAPTMTPTRGFSNRIFTPPTPDVPADHVCPECDCDDDTESPPTEESAEPTPAPAPASTQPSLKLSELLPNPAGSDALDEFIEIYNESDEVLELTGWSLRDASGSQYTFDDESLAAKGYLGVPRGVSGIALNNTTTETVELLNAEEVVVDAVSYDVSAGVDWVYALSHDLWQWSALSTPGSANFIQQPNQKPVASLSMADEVDQHASVVLDASDSLDANGDALQYLWSFGDRSKRALTTEPVIEHVFAKSGTFNARVWVGDGYATSSAKSTITVLETDAPAALADVVTASVPTPTPSPAPTPLVAAAKSTKLTYTVSLADIDARVKGDKVITEGTVLVEPGVLGASIFYIGNPGVEVYMYTKDFPELSRGDLVRVTGEISKPYGMTRIKLKSQSDIAVLSHKEDVVPEPTSLGTIGDTLLGDVVSVSGEVVENSSSKTVIENDEGTINVVAKDTTGIMIDAGIGDVVEIAGILSKTNSGYRVLPRDELDVTTVATADEFISSTPAVSSSSTSKKVYLPAIAGGLTSVALAMLWQQRAENNRPMPLPAPRKHRKLDDSLES